MTNKSETPIYDQHDSLLSDRRNFVKGAAAVLGGSGFLLGGQAAAAQNLEERIDPTRPPGLGPKAMIDMRFPMSYERSVPAAVKVIVDYFAALQRRDLSAIADQMHFPFGTFEEVKSEVVETRENFMKQPPASMNVVDLNPRRFTDRDGFLKPGAYDIFMNLEVLGSDPVRAAIAMTYDRYDGNGKRLLRCEGIYSICNNDGKWGIQLMSTIFTPDHLIGMTYEDTIAAVKRIRIHHVVAFQQSDRFWESLVMQLGRQMACGITGPAPHYAGPAGNIMECYKIVGVKSRLRVTEVTQEQIDSNATRAAAVPAEDPYYIEYRDLFPASGVGEWGWVTGTNPETRVVHHNYHKAHLISGAFRFTASGEIASHSNGLEVMTFKKGRWGRASGVSAGLLYATIIDRSNDVLPGPGGKAPQGIG
jgi:hypothetical protein